MSRIDLLRGGKVAVHDLAIENLGQLDELHKAVGARPFVVYTFPIRLQGMTRLPCRVVAEVQTDRLVSLG